MPVLWIFMVSHRYIFRFLMNGSTGILRRSVASSIISRVIYFSGKLAKNLQELLPFVAYARIATDRHIFETLSNVLTLSRLLYCGIDDASWMREQIVSSSHEQKPSVT
jgi:hypothetical protein